MRGHFVSIHSWAFANSPNSPNVANPCISGCALPMSPDLLREHRAARLTDPGLIAVIRAPSAEVVPRLGEALVAGGITALEVTTSTPNFAAAIRATKSALG